VSCIKKYKTDYELEEIYSYVFTQENDDESNLETKYLGRTECENIFEDYNLNKK
jgi:hypothetical protein